MSKRDRYRNKVFTLKRTLYALLDITISAAIIFVVHCLACV